MTLRIVFMGTPEFAVPTLSEIIGQGHQVVAVYTQPPRAAGRGMALRQSPVHEFAARAGIPVLAPGNLKDSAEQEKFAAHDADAAVVVAYGLILPQMILDNPREGCFNLHASLLPRWRGAAPIQRAIMAGDRETGICVMRMQAGLDTGPVCMAERVAITADMTAGQLHDTLAMRGGDLMIRALAAQSRGLLTCQPQPTDGVTYAAKIDKGETRIDWSHPADQVHNHVRGLSPTPGAWCEMAFGGRAERVKILRTALADASGAPGTVLDDMLTIACGAGAIRISELQRAGKSPMVASDFLRGAGLKAGDRIN